MHKQRHRTLDVHSSFQRRETIDEIDLLKQSWKFKPKHLSGHESDKGKKSKKTRNVFYKQTTSEIINRNKQMYLNPIKDLQKIMRHFHNKFDDNNGKIVLERTKNNRRKRVNSINENQGMQVPIERKIETILQLPTLKRVNTQAKRLKTQINNRNNQRQKQKKSILNKFQNYFYGQIDLIDRNKVIQSDALKEKKQIKNFRKQRMKTIN